MESMPSVSALCSHGTLVSPLPATLREALQCIFPSGMPFDGRLHAQRMKLVRNRDKAAPTSALLGASPHHLRG